MAAGAGWSFKRPVCHQTAARPPAEANRRRIRPVTVLEFDQDLLTKERFEFRIIGHRMDPGNADFVQLRIDWEVAGDESASLPRDAGLNHPCWEWQAEATIQMDAPDALWAYWRSVPGGRESLVGDRDEWVALDITSARCRGRKRKQNGRRRLEVDVLVTWVGSPESLWQPETWARENAAAHLDAFWASQGGRSLALSKLSGATRRLAADGHRPRKSLAPEVDEDLRGVSPVLGTLCYV